MNYLIDIDIICEIRKGTNCDLNVATWYEAIQDTDIYLSILALGDIRKGIEQARLSNPVQARALESWLATVIRAFADRILPIDQAVADEWGRISAKSPVLPIEALLLATAKVYGMTLVAKCVNNLPNLDVTVLNPFESPR